MSIKSSISDFFRIDELKENLLKLIEAKFELKKLELQEKLESILAALLTKLILVVFLMLAFVFANILLAVFINQLTETFWLGYATLLVVYVLLFLGIRTQTKTFENKIKEKIAAALENAGL